MIFNKLHAGITGISFLRFRSGWDVRKRPPSRMSKEDNRNKHKYWAAMGPGARSGEPPLTLVLMVK